MTKNKNQLSITRTVSVQRVRQKANSYQFALLLAALLLLGNIARAADPAIPDMKGTWVGTLEGVVAGKALYHANASATPDFSKITFTIVVENQQGRAFYGSKSSAKAKDTMLGIVSEDGKLVSMVEDDVISTGTLVNADTMVVRALGSGKNHKVATAGTFTRKKAARTAAPGK